MKRRTLLSGTAALATTLLAGCVGGDGDDGGAPPETSPPTATASPSPIPTPTPASVGRREYPDYEWERLEGTTPTATTTIAMRNARFRPPVAAVPAGSTVAFANEDGSSHTVTIPALDVDRRVRGGESVEVRLDREGTFDYVCTFHPPGMLGRLVVGGSPGGQSETATPTATAGGGGGDGGYY